MRSRLDVAIVVIVFVSLAVPMLLHAWRLWEEFSVQRRAAALMQSGAELLDDEQRSPTV